MGSVLLGMGKRATAAAMILLTYATLTGVAHATYPGHNGLLAVQPLTGGGAALVQADGHVVRSVCRVASDPCATPGGPPVGAPLFSPGGRTLALDAAAPVIVDLAGRCVDCGGIYPNSDASFETTYGLDFEPDGDLSYLDFHSLVTIGITGFTAHQQTIPLPAADDPTAAVTSAAGTLAVSSQDRVYVERGGRLHPLGAGSEPSWAPSGRQLAIDRNGWIWDVPTTGTSGRRLARGNHPAFSPDGRQVAYVGAHNHIEVVSVTGGRPHPLGTVTGRAVAWGAAPSSHAPACSLPQGTKVLASADGTEVGTLSSVSDGQTDTVGCAESSGLQRVLAVNNLSEDGDVSDTVEQVAVGGDYAALVDDYQDLHYGGSGSYVDLVDVATGQDHGSVNPCLTGCTPTSVVVAPDGSYAALSEFSDTCPGGAGTATSCSYDEINAVHDSKVTALDVTYAAAPGTVSPALTDLTVSGQTVSWLHGSTPQSATLP